MMKKKIDYIVELFNKKADLEDEGAAFFLFLFCLLTCIPIGLYMHISRFCNFFVNKEVDVGDDL